MTDAAATSRANSGLEDSAGPDGAERFGAPANPGSGAAANWPQWPGVARPAGWFLPVPGEAAPPGEPGTEPARTEESGPKPGTEPPTRAEPTGPAAPVVGPTAALRGRPGGPGFIVCPEAENGPAAGSAKSGWQLAHGLWRGSGIRWEEPAPGPLPARPPGHAEQAFAASQAFLSAPAFADAPPEAVVRSAPIRTGEAGERFRAWSDSVREASAPPVPPARPGNAARRRNVVWRLAGTGASVGVPAAVIVTVGAGAIMMLTGKSGPMLGSSAEQNSRVRGTATAPAGGGGQPGGFGGYPGQHGTVTVNSFASSGGTRLAVGAADGHPAIWRRGASGTWSLVSAGQPAFTAPGLAPSAVYGVTATAAGFVAVGTHSGRPAVWTTRNGLSWTPAALPLPRGATSAALRSVTATDGTVVAKGEADTGHGSFPFTATSHDNGSTWSEANAN